VNYQLAELEAALPPDEFFRARREVLVNMSRIKSEEREQCRACLHARAAREAFARVARKTLHP
jgi:DNA-binding LytR/AlgR family response regulator